MNWILTESLLFLNQKAIDVYENLSRGGFIKLRKRGRYKEDGLEELKM